MCFLASPSDPDFPVDKSQLENWREGFIEKRGPWCLIHTMVQLPQVCTDFVSTALRLLYTIVRSIAPVAGRRATSTAKAKPAGVTKAAGGHGERGSVFAALGIVIESAQDLVRWLWAFVTRTVTKVDSCPVMAGEGGGIGAMQDAADILSTMCHALNEQGGAVAVAAALHVAAVVDDVVRIVCSRVDVHEKGLQTRVLHVTACVSTVVAAVPALAAKVAWNLVRAVDTVIPLRGGAESESHCVLPKPFFHLLEKSIGALREQPQQVPAALEALLKVLRMSGVELLKLTRYGCRAGGGRPGDVELCALHGDIAVGTIAALSSLVDKCVFAPVEAVSLVQTVASVALFNAEAAACESVESRKACFAMCRELVSKHHGTVAGTAVLRAFVDSLSALLDSVSGMLPAASAPDRGPAAAPRSVYSVVDYKEVREKRADDGYVGLRNQGFTCKSCRTFSLFSL